MRKYILILLTIFLVSCGPSVDYSEFTQCVTDSGAKMFGAYWCSHCQEQKQELGKAWENINYVECSLPGGKGQTEVCAKEGIEGYPTWQFADGERMSGKLSLELISKKTNCPLP